MKYTWKHFDKDTRKIEKWLRIRRERFNSVYGIPRGGLVIAVKISNKFGIPLLLDKEEINEGTLIVDDISDTGKTLKKFKEKNLIVTLFYHKDTIAFPNFTIREKKKDWIIFPWER